MKNQKGFSLVELLVVVIIIAIVAAIAIPNLLSSRRVANEAAAVASMRTFHSANITYSALQTPNSYAPDAAALVTAKLIDSGFAAAIDGAGLKSTYDWTYTFAAASPQVYTLTATSGTGSSQKSYFINEEGVIRFHLPAANGDGVAAVVGDQPIP